MSDAMAKLLLLLSMCLGIFVLSQAQQDKSLFDNAKFFGATNFTDFLSKAGLDADLKNQGEWTVFAPLNSAFDALPQDVLQRLESDSAFLKEVLSYHIINGKFMYPSFTNEELLPSLEGSSLRVNKYSTDKGSVTTVSGSTLKLVDLPANNGLLTLTDRVIYPAPSGTTLDYISDTDSLSTLLLAVAKAGISQDFTGNHLTLFAPSDVAFSRLPPGELDTLLSDVPKLQEVLKLHMVDTETYYSAGLYQGLVLKSVNGESLSITTSSGLSVNGFTVSTTDIPVNNGVVHIIDDVLMPSSTPHIYK